MNFFRVSLPCSVLAASLAALAAAPARLTLTPRPDADATRYVLTWEATPGALERVQRSTDLGTNANWRTFDAVFAGDAGGSVEVPGANGTNAPFAFYRLQTAPEIFDVQPTFLNSSDSNAVLYLLGQGLPTNATVLINGHEVSSTPASTNGVWRVVSLNGLPPGEPNIRGITVLDNDTSNVVVTVTLQTPVVHDTAMRPEQWQGPPEEPSSTPYAMKRGYDYYQAQSHLNASRKGYEYYQNRSDFSSASAQSSQKGKGASVGKPNLGKMYRLADPGGVEDDDDEEPAAGVAIPRFISVTQEAKKAAAKADIGTIRPPGPRVVPGSGELQWEETDLVVPGRGLDFVWRRSYRSRTGNLITLDDRRWSFSYDISLAQISDGTLELRPGNGRTDTFYPNTTGGWSRDEYFAEIADLDLDGRMEMVFADKGRWIFRALDPADLSGGKLEEIADRYGNTVTLHYDKGGRLTEIVDDIGRTNSVAYNGAGQIESITDCTGRTVRYEYDTNGDLAACVSPAITGAPLGNDFPDGITNRYSYTSGHADERLNHNLVSATDGKGQTWLTVGYHATTNDTAPEFDTVDFIARGPHVEHLRRYPQTPTPGNQFATLKVVLRDAMGNVREELYDSRLRCVQLTEFTGRAPDVFAPTTESANRPVNKLRAEDPDAYVTAWSWNPDSLCTLEVAPDGARTRMIYERDFDPATGPRKKGDLRVAREFATSAVDFDGDGVAETSEVAWRFEHHPEFGSAVGGERTPIIKGSALGKVIIGILTKKSYAAYSALALEVQGRQYNPALDYLPGDSAVFNDQVVGRKRPPGGWDGSVTRPGYSARSSQPKIVENKKRLLADFGILSSQAGFITSATDPRGVTTTTSYDTQGSRKKIRRESDGYAPWEMSFEYSPHGQLTAVTNAADATGRYYWQKHVFSDDPFTSPREPALIIEDAGADGLALTNRFEHDARGNLVRTVSPLGHDWLYTYNALGQMTSKQTPQSSFGTLVRNGVYFAHDENGNVTTGVTELRDEADVFIRHITNRFDYDLLDQCRVVSEQVLPGVFVTNKFSYDANGQLSVVESPLYTGGVDLHANALFEHDERGLVLREVFAPGSPVGFTNRFSHSAQAVTTNISIGLGVTAVGATYSVPLDGFQRPAAVIDPMGNMTTFTHDRAGNLILTRVFGELHDVEGGADNVRLAEWRGRYDWDNQLVETRAAFFDPRTQAALGDGARVNTFTYAPNGQLLTRTDDNGHTTSFAYDTAGRLASVTDAKTNVVQFAHDADGNVILVTSVERPDLTPGVQEFFTAHAYDSQGRQVRSLDSAGNTNRWAFDSLSRCVRATDARGNDTVFYFDDLGRGQDVVHHVAEKERGITINTSHVEYDVNNRVVSVTDGNTNTTFYAHDTLGRVAQVIRADGTVCSLVWSPRSNLLRVQDPNGTVISNRYDLLDRLVARDITPGPTVASSTTFERFAHDGLSQLVAATNDAAQQTFEFDSLGNGSRWTSNGREATAFHDGEGNCVTMIYPSGLVVNYGRNARDEVSSITTRRPSELPVPLATFAHDGPGRLARIARENGANTRFVWNGALNPANEAGDFGWRQISQVNHQVAGGGAVLDRRVAKFDRAQNRVERAQTVPFSALGLLRTNLMDYDALDRMTNFATVVPTMIEDKYVFTLDAEFNRVAVSSNGVDYPYTMDATPLPGPADFQMNQYTITPFGFQSHDENGNHVMRVASTAQLLYQYDYDDRLVSISDLSTGELVPVVSYAYGPLGECVSETTYPPAPLAAVTKERFNNQFEMELNPDVTLVETYTGGTLIESFIHKLDDGLLVARLGPVGPPVHYHTDDLGSVLALTGAGGVVLGRNDYGDSGQPEFLNADGFAVAPPASSGSKIYLYGGMDWDVTAGMYHDGAGGFYDPQTARALRGKVKNIRDMGGSPSMGRGKVKVVRDTGNGRGDAATRGKVKVIKDMGSNFSESAAVRGKVKSVRDMGSNRSAFGGNPWSGASLKLIAPIAMDKGLRFAREKAGVRTEKIKFKQEFGPTQATKKN